MTVRLNITSELRKVLAFTAVGVIGFVVDASVLHLGIAVGLGLCVGRGVSYLVAVTVTWLLNRRYTFRAAATPAHIAEWGRFASSQLGGATVNLGVYYALVQVSEYVRAYPVIGVACGSLSGLLINYAVARIFVFGRRSATDDTALH